MRCFRHYPFGVKGFKCEPTTIAFLNRIERNIHDPQLFNLISVDPQPRKLLA